MNEGKNIPPSIYILRLLWVSFEFAINDQKEQAIQKKWTVKKKLAVSSQEVACLCSDKKVREISYDKMKRIAKGTFL